MSGDMKMTGDESVLVADSSFMLYNLCDTEVQGVIARGDGKGKGRRLLVGCL